MNEYEQIAKRSVEVIDQLDKQKEVKRTLNQNAAIHLLFKQLADQLNDSGLDLKKVLLGNPVEIPWTETMVKEILWRPVQKIQIGKESTTQLTSKQVDEVFLTLNRHLGQKLGIQLDFPSIKSLMDKSRQLDN